MNTLRVQDLIAFVREEFDVEADEHTKLYSTGLLDSYALVDFALFIEKKVSVKIDLRALTVDNFDTISAVKKLVDQQASEARQEVAP